MSANGVNVSLSHPQQVAIPDYGQEITWSEISQVNSTTALVGVYSGGSLVGTIQVPIEGQGSGGYTLGGVIRTDIGGMVYVYPAPESITFVGLDRAVSNATTVVKSDSSVMSTLGGSFNITLALPYSFNIQTGEFGSVMMLNVVSPNGHFMLTVDLGQRQVLSVTKE